MTRKCLFYGILFLFIAATFILIFTIYYNEQFPKKIAYVFQTSVDQKSESSSNGTDTLLNELVISKPSCTVTISVPKIDYEHYKETVEEMQHFLKFASKSIISADERVTYRRVIKEFIEMADANKLDYFIEGGTLIGSYRHHGFVPWDDDFDVRMNYNERPRIKEIFAKLKQEGKSKLILNTDIEGGWKVYLDIPESKNAGEYRFKWPYIDLLFHKENNGILRGSGAVLKKTDVFPLSHRLFEGMMIQSPRCMRNILSESSRTTCCANPYSHKNEHRLSGGDKVCIKCSRLSQFPLVTHKKINDTAYNETLYLGKRVIHSVILRDCL